VPERDHDISLAIWDLSTPVVVGRRATLKVGVACPSACNLAGTRVDVYDGAGRRSGAGTLGSSPWPATSALYWVELDIAPTEAEGDQAWRIEATPESTHVSTTSLVHVVACKPPEHRVTVEVVDNKSRLPLGGVELRLGSFRAATNEAGIAHLELPSGNYEVGTWKVRYEMVSTTVHVAGDMTIHLELTPESEPEQPYWM
jgi:hypothetical protein